jgi:hypothetical protein
VAKIVAVSAGASSLENNGRRQAAVARLGLDAAAAEAVTALRAAGIRAILLKGPAIAHWLYDEPWERTYGDIDLLVAPDQHRLAGQILQRLGYENCSLKDPVIRPHASQWRRAGPPSAEIDLHWQVPLATRGADSWTVLGQETEPMPIGSATVEILSPAARAMLTAVHAAQHGTGIRKSVRDLELALGRVDLVTWARSAELARRVGVSDPFAVGLRLLPAGADVAEKLGLESAQSVEAHLRSVTPAATSLGWMHLLEQRSPRAALQLVRSELLPTPGFMRVWSPTARKGPMGLTCAYLGRPLWLLWQLPSALRDLRRARRQARR